MKKQIRIKKSVIKESIKKAILKEVNSRNLYDELANTISDYENNVREYSVQQLMKKFYRGDKPVDIKMAKAIAEKLFQHLQSIRNDEQQMLKLKAALEMPKQEFSEQKPEEDNEQHVEVERQIQEDDNQEQVQEEPVKQGKTFKKQKEQKWDDSDKEQKKDDKKKPFSRQKKFN